MKFTGNNFILSNTDTHCVKVYSNNHTGDCFAVGFGQFFGKDWIQGAVEESGTWGSKEYDQEGCDKMLASVQEHVQSLDKARFGGRVCIVQTHLHQLTLRTGIVQKRPRDNGVKLEVFRDLSFDYVPGEWMAFNVGVHICALLAY